MAGGIKVYASLEHRKIHGEVVPPEVADEEVVDEHMGHGQDGLDAMDPQGHVEPPAGHVAAGNHGVVQNEARAANNDHSPKYGPVIELLPVTPAIKSRRFVPTQEPA